jgi:hypothetical protein
MVNEQQGMAAANPRASGSTVPGESVSPAGERPEQEPPRSARPWLRRELPLAVVLVVVAALADFGLWATLFGGAGDSEPVSSSVRDITPSSARSGQVQPAGQHASSSAGISVHSTLLASGVLQTRSRVGFPHPVSGFELSVTAANASRTGSSFHPTVDHLQVLVAGRPVTGVPHRIGRGHDVRVSLPRSSRAVEVAYQAAGVTARSQPSKAGRALLLATPLHISASTTTRTTLSLRGSHILNLGCWPPGSPPRACGEQSGAGWTVRLPAHAGADDVVAQINVPTRASSPAGASG